MHSTHYGPLAWGVASAHRESRYGSPKGDQGTARSPAETNQRLLGRDWEASSPTIQGDESWFLPSETTTEGSVPAHRTGDGPGGPGKFKGVLEDLDGFRIRTVGFYLALYTPKERLEALSTLLPLVTGPFNSFTGPFNSFRKPSQLPGMYSFLPLEKSENMWLNSLEMY